jgi:hypothetical protein
MVTIGSKFTMGLVAKLGPSELDTIEEGESPGGNTKIDEWTTTRRGYDKRPRRFGEGTTTRCDP